MPRDSRQHQQLERFRRSDDAHGRVEKRRGARTIAASTWRGGTEAKRKHWGRKRYVDIWDQFLEFSQGLFGDNAVAWALTHVYNSPSCCHGLDHAAMRTRACELIVKLHWGTIPKRLAKAHDRTGCVWHVRLSAANADGFLTDPVTVEANWNAVQGVPACISEKGLEDKMTFFYIRARAIILEPTRWLTRLFSRQTIPMVRARKQQAGRVPPVCGTVNVLFSQGFRILRYYSCLATGSAPRMALIGRYTHHSFDEWATDEPEDVH